MDGEWIGCQVIAGGQRGFEPGEQRIRPFPVGAEPPEAESGSGWTYAAVGPVQALTKVRVASQAERNDFLLQQFLEAAYVDLDVEEAEFEFKLSDASPPLNWRLTDRQKADIHEMWRRIEGNTNGPLKVVDQFFERVKP